MPVALHWYGRNEANLYPVDDTALWVSDPGDSLPAGVLVDCALRWPAALGDRAWVSGVTVTDKLAAVTFQAAGGPLGVAVTTGPVVVGRPVKVDAQAAGVGGWAVFGTGALGAAGGGRGVRAMLSRPEQGLLALKAARPYVPSRVTGFFAGLSGARLGGVVGLDATKPVRVAYGHRTYRGRAFDCAVFYLADDGVDSFAPVIAAGPSSVFVQFAGPCGARPESFTCDDPQPVERVNAVSPDCGGKLTLKFEGPVIVSEVAGRAAVVVHSPLSARAACPPRYQPDSLGSLPTEIPDVDVPVPPPPPPVPLPASASAGGSSFLTCFATGLTGWTVRGGVWTPSGLADPAPLCPGGAAAASASASALNLLTYDGSDAGLGRVLEAHFKLDPSTGGDRRNAGIVLNWGAWSVGGPMVAHLVVADALRQTLSIGRLAAGVVGALATVPVPGLAAGRVYAVRTRVIPERVGRAVLTAELVDLAASLTVATIGETLAPLYGAPVGLWGLYADRAVARFSSFRVT
jgi:hypothetical protein